MQNLDATWSLIFTENNEVFCVSIVVEAGHILCDPRSSDISSRPGLQDTDHRRSVCVHPSTAPDRSLCLDQKEEAY